MSGTNGTVNRITGTSTLVRARFEPGMLLQHDDLEQMSTYTRELNRLMFRSLFGCGVVCGLKVTPTRDCGKDAIVIGAGLALDGCGDPIYVPKDVSLTIDEHCQPGKDPLWVQLCRTSKCCSPRTATCGCDDEETSSVCAREREGYEIRIVRDQPKCSCQCDLPKESKGEPFKSDCLCVDPTLPCYVDHYKGICGCCCDDCAGGSCDCDCVVLAKLSPPVDDKSGWTADHRVRRFVRPVLMRDPVVAEEEEKRTAPQKAEEMIVAERLKKTRLNEVRMKAMKTAKAPPA